MPDRRGFLGAVAALVAAPWVPKLPDTPRGDWVVEILGLPVEAFDLERAKTDVIYFLDWTQFHRLPLLPHAQAIITNVRDIELGEPPVKTTNGLMLLSEQAAERRKG